MAGALCWHQCCSRTVPQGEQNWRAQNPGTTVGRSLGGTQISKSSELKSAMEAQSLESEKQEKPNLQGLFKQVVQQKKAFNKQPGQIEEENGSDSIRGRPSATRKNRSGHPAKHGKQNLDEPVAGKEPLKRVTAMAKSASWVAAARARLKQRMFAASTSATKESKEGESKTAAGSNLVGMA